MFSATVILAQCAQKSLLAKRSGNVSVCQKVPDCGSRLPQTVKQIGNGDNIAYQFVAKRPINLQLSSAGQRLDASLSYSVLSSWVAKW